MPLPCLPCSSSSALPCLFQVLFDEIPLSFPQPRSRLSATAVAAKELEGRRVTQPFSASQSAEMVLLFPPCRALLLSSSLKFTASPSFSRLPPCCLPASPQTELPSRLLPSRATGFNMQEGHASCHAFSHHALLSLLFLLGFLLVSEGRYFFSQLPQPLKEPLHCHHHGYCLCLPFLLS